LFFKLVINAILIYEGNDISHTKQCPVFCLIHISELPVTWILTRYDSRKHWNVYDWIAKIGHCCKNHAIASVWNLTIYECYYQTYLLSLATQIIIKRIFPQTPMTQTQMCDTEITNAFNISRYHWLAELNSHVPIIMLDVTWNVEKFMTTIPVMRHTTSQQSVNVKINVKRNEAWNFYWLSTIC
jgi:hypothetical protein